uniref:Tetrapyrrole biosynthesis uroporphyrinogen III synthase domain-containing protein n=1 Tax=Branchiostoma floridae TaxID=7739 RepID=C3Y5A8_BRAFL|eukprot:XP_002608631.1 hypothetical protein BRAFLDRAFT_127880 [Branchiostoma floridae]
MGILLLREPREEKGTDPYEQEFVAAGLQVKSVEVLSFEFCSLPELRSLVKKPEEFSGMVFTSQRSVEAVTRCLQEARSLGLTPSGEECGTATQLADLITQKFTSNSKALLFPCGFMRRETLPSALSAANIPLTELRVYQTTAHPDIDKRLQAYIAEQIAAIGPTTAEAMTSAGLSVACTAEKPNPQALLAAIQATIAAQATEDPT